MDLVAAHAYDVSNDPRQTAKLDGPVWKYGFWPDIARKDLLQLKLCGQRVHARVRWLQRHLSGSFNDADNCPEASMEIKKEICNFLNTRKFKAMEQNI
jgi:hypothetical protein